VKLELQLRSLRLVQPLHTAYGAIAERPLVLIALKGDDGISGYGEAAPLQPYDGVSVGRVCAALKRHAAALQSGAEPEGCDPREIAGVLDACVHTGDCGIRPVIVELHQIVDNALADITLSQLLGTEANVDAALHHIQGIKQKDNRF